MRQQYSEYPFLLDQYLLRNEVINSLTQNIFLEWTNILQKWAVLSNTLPKLLLHLCK